MTNWHPEDIKSAIRKRGSTLAALAEKHGVTTQAMSASVSGRCSERCDLIIAEFLNMKPSDIWPSRYHKDGTRIRLRRSSNERSAAA